MADAVTRALRAEPGSVLVFLPGAGRDPPHRDAADASASMPRPTWSRSTARSTPPTQDRAIAPAPAGRRKVVLATSIAETCLTIEGVRVVVDRRPGARAALRAGRRADAARDRARLARRRRPAPRPRRAHRARRLLSPVGRAADRLARSLCAAGDPRVRPLVLRAGSGRLGRGDRRRWPSSIRRRRARSPRRARCSPSSARSTRRPHHRARPGAAPPAAAAAARPHGGRCGARGRGRSRRRYRGAC